MAYVMTQGLDLAEYQAQIQRGEQQKGCVVQVEGEPNSEARAAEVVMNLNQ